KGAVAPGLRLAAGRAAGPERGPVGAAHDGLVHERPPEIAFVELKEDHRALSALGLEQLQRGVDRVHTPAGRDLGYAPSLGVPALGGGGDHDVLPPDAVDEALAGRRRLDVAAAAGAGVGSGAR